MHLTNKTSNSNITNMNQINVFDHLVHIYNEKSVKRVYIESFNQRTIGPENAHLKPDPGVLSHHEMTLTLNTHTPLLNS